VFVNRENTLSTRQNSRPPRVKPGRRAPADHETERPREGTFKEMLSQYAADGDVVGFTTLAIEEAERRIPSGNPQAQSLVLLLLRVVSLLEYDVEVAAQKPHGFSKAGFHLCWVLRLTGPIEGAAVAALMGQSRATVSGIAITLANEGIVQKQATAEDQRLVLLSLTPAGKSRFEAAMRAVNQRNIEWANALSSSEISSLVGLLTKLASGADSNFHRRQ
jgi:DNA-binding MarR family transcriptional regulator